MATKAELYERAGELGVASRDGMNKSQLANAIMERENKGNPIEEPTPQQMVSARSKSSEGLVSDSVGEDVRKSNAANRELKVREKKATEAKAAASRRRQLPQQYVITKGCRLSRNGFLTDLAVDSIVSAKTHNLNEIKRNGGEFEECKGTKMIRDQFGRMRTVPVR